MDKNKSSALVWSKNSGRNGWDAVFDVREDQSVESRNIHLYNGGIGTRRGGATSVSFANGANNGPANALVEYIPGQDQTLAELFLVDATAPVRICRCAGGTSFVNLTLADDVATEPYTFSAVTLNGKLYCAYDTTVNRIHVFDPAYSTTILRRGGMGTTAAATVANTGAGTYAAVIRYYKVRFAEIRSSVTIREGEPSPVVSFTPSGAGTAARVTKPATLSEGETHWILMASPDGVTFYDLATTVVGTTTYDDSAATTSYASGTASPSSGARTPFPSVKALATDGNRLLGFGVWETTAGDSMSPKQGRVYIGPVLDSTSTNDDERINNTTTLQGFLDLSRNAGSVDRGITPKPINSIFHAFQSAGVYALIPTESPTTPYRRVCLSSDIGSLSQQSIVMAADRLGRACCFFLDPVRGPYTVGGPDGLRWCGKDVADLWATVNREATTIAAWGLWFPGRSQVWFAVATGASNTPNLLLVLDPTAMTVDEDGDLRGGWVSYDGDLAAARCGVVFSNTLAATRTRTRVPYVGQAGAGQTVLRYNESVNQDGATNFQAYAKSGARAVDSHVIELQKAYLMATAQSGVSVRQTLIRNTGDETSRTSDVTLTAVGSETSVLKKFEDAALQDAWSFQVQLGDSAAQNVAWQLFQWRAKVASRAEF